MPSTDVSGIHPRSSDSIIVLSTMVLSILTKNPEEKWRTYTSDRVRFSRAYDS